jgi:XTP/dITP diphosphohydrolase
LRVVVATKNPGKVRELRALLGDLPIELIGAEEMPEVEETGTTFSENAILKARATAEWSGEWAIADDSGIEVDALDGAPGVYSNRYFGENTTEEQRNAALIGLLAEIPTEKRTCRYRAAIAVASPDGRVLVTEGACEGLLIDEPRGEHGFGYDPHFMLPEYGQTMAEIDPKLKNRISHRARALAEALPILEKLADGS